jgi:hypothetical protein
VFFASRPLGRGETTPRRESPEGPPKVVAMNRVWLVEPLLVAREGCWRILDAVWGERAALCADSTGCEVGGLRSEPVSSEEPPPLLHRLVDLFECFRLLLRAGFWGVVGPLRPGGVGSESRDEDDVNSDIDSVVEDPELAMAVACGCALAMGKNAGRLDVGEACGAPLFGGDAG